MLTQSIRRLPKGAQNKAQQIHDDKSNQADSCDEKYRWRKQVRWKMVDPSARDRRDRQQERDSQCAAAAGDGKDAGEQHQGKQDRDNESSAFDCFDKRREEEE